MGKPVHKTWKREASIPRFVNPQFRALVRPSGCSEVPNDATTVRLSAENIFMESLFLDYGCILEV